MPNINHKEISNRLKELGFYQTVENRTACWYNGNYPHSLSCYYSTYDKSYLIGYSDIRYYFLNVFELNSRIGTINDKLRK